MLPHAHAHSQIDAFRASVTPWWTTAGGLFAAGFVLPDSVSTISFLSSAGLGIGLGIASGVAAYLKTVTKAKIDARREWDAAMADSLSAKLETALAEIKELKLEIALVRHDHEEAKSHFVSVAQLFLKQEGVVT